MRKIYTALPQAVEPCPSPNEARMEKNVGYRYEKNLYKPVGTFEVPLSRADALTGRGKPE